MKKHMRTLRRNFRAMNLEPPKTRSKSHRTQDFAAYEALNKKIRVALTKLGEREERALKKRAALISSR